MSNGMLGWPAPIQDESPQVYAHYYKSTSTVVAGSLNTFFPINFDTMLYDNWACVRVGSEWSFRAPLDGLYFVELMMEWTAAYSRQFVGLFRRRPSQAFSSGGHNFWEYRLAMGDNLKAIMGSSVIPMRANELLTPVLQIQSSGTTNTNSTNNNSIIIRRLGSLNQANRQYPGFAVDF